MITDTILEDDRWQQPDLAALAEGAAKATLTHLGHDPANYEIAVLGCDDRRIATLNADFRGKPQPTNVLSWPETDLSADAPGASPDAPPQDDTGPHPLGDIAIAYDTCAREAAAAGKSLPDHATHLIVHGLLHLLGYDHVRDADATLMEGLEVAILGNLGLPDPYMDKGA
ncbi:MAG: rRNA maturation RNase YbeY [Paracoccaceae bacterium]|nr:rRNA maturation RNase YbeY [Paracoccaceae bacterium]